MSDTSDVSETSEDIQASQDSDSELSEQASPDNVPAPELNVPVPRWGTGQGPLQGDVPWYQRFQKR